MKKNPEGNLLDSVKEFVNQPEFLPHKVRLESVSSAGVEFVDSDGYKLPVEDLSDGYRSILSMTFELIRQLAQVYGAKNIFDPDDKTKVIVPGVVLIDEIDAHLHPTWQRRSEFGSAHIFQSFSLLSPLTAPWSVKQQRLERFGVYRNQVATNLEEW